MAISFNPFILFQTFARESCKSECEINIALDKPPVHLGAANKLFISTLRVMFINYK